MKHVLRVLALGMALGGTTMQAQLPASGRPVPVLSDFDDAMQAYMSAHRIGAGVLGVMVSGRIVYLRGFGHDYYDNPLPENALFRLASCTKPMTAAAVRQVAADVGFSTTLPAFSLGVPGSPGVLDLSPFPSSGDTRIGDIEVRDLLEHRGGWNEDVTDDIIFKYEEAATDMMVTRPPSQEAMMRWALGRPLQFDPGSEEKYANVGYHALGLIVEQESGQDLVAYIQEHILTPDMWVPSTELQLGRTYRVNQDPREPLYDHPDLCGNVFEGGPPMVSCPYGDWHQEGIEAFGGMIASAPTILAYLQRYHTAPFDARIGRRISPTFPVDAVAAHTGALDGTNTLMLQRPDGINVYVAFNKRGEPHYAWDFYDVHLRPVLDDGTTSWPSTTSDGFWTTTVGEGSGGVGGYHAPFNSFPAALDYVQAGSKLRLFSGSTSWTGVLSKKLLLDAPMGPAVIGE